MKWYDAIGQWFLKSVFFVFCVRLLINGIAYFADGNYLIIDRLIPIDAIFALCSIPIGLLVGMGLLYVISDTEKEVETPGG